MYPSSRFFSSSHPSPLFSPSAWFFLVSFSFLCALLHTSFNDAEKNRPFPSRRVNLVAATFSLR